MNTPTLPGDLDPATRARQRAIAATIAAERPATRPRPAYFIDLGYSRRTYNERAAGNGLADTIHRGPRCPISDLNIGWRLPERLGADVVPALVAIREHLHPCSHCFTETEITTMSSELAYYTPPAHTLEQRKQAAAAIADAVGLPEAIRGNPASVLLAFQLAEGLQVDPRAAMGHFHWLKGVPTPDAHLIQALVRRAGHVMRLQDGKNDAGVPYATCTIIRADDPEYPISVTWTLDDAAKAGLWWGAANAKINPRAHLKRRAAVECARDACAEVLLGMNLAPADAEGPWSTTPTNDAWQQAEAAADAPEADPEADIADADIVEDAPAGDTPEQLRAAWAEVQAHGDTIGWTVADLKREYQAWAGRPVDTATVAELTTYAATLGAKLEAFVGSDK